MGSLEGCRELMGRSRAPARLFVSTIRKIRDLHLRKNSGPHHAEFVTQHHPRMWFRQLLAFV